MVLIPTPSWHEQHPRVSTGKGTKLIRQQPMKQVGKLTPAMLHKYPVLFQGDPSGEAGDKWTLQLKSDAWAMTAPFWHNLQRKSFIQSTALPPPSSLPTAHTITASFISTARNQRGVVGAPKDVHILTPRICEHVISGCRWN